MSYQEIRNYVAIGDSLSEGLGDFAFEWFDNREGCGWTDRLATLLTIQAEARGHKFHYANFAIRGTKLRKIMTTQLDAALALNPDFITVMAGANDIMTKVKKLPELERVYREGLMRIQASGAKVIVANIMNPVHLRVFSPMAYRANRITALIERSAAELGIKVIDIHGIHELHDLRYWADDMVHFSGHGHIKVANRAAELMNLDYRMPEAKLPFAPDLSRSLRETIRWVRNYLLPFFKRKLTGRSSGDGFEAKYPSFTRINHEAFETFEVVLAA
ncbi:MAG: hypothetical protein RL196_1423 [Actinomycetota bacterium]